MIVSTGLWPRRVAHLLARVVVVMVALVPLPAGAAGAPQSDQGERRQGVIDDLGPDRVPGTAPAVPRKVWPVGVGTGAFTAPLSEDPFGVVAMLSLSRETPRWALDSKGIYGLGTADRVRGHFVVFSIGARFYSAGGDTSLFVALGPSVSHMFEPGGMDIADCTYCPPMDRKGRLSGTGLGAYAEVG
jgi:hypothetical protein